MSARSLAIASSLILTLTITASPARAGRYDLTLGNFFSNRPGACSADFNCAQGLFEDLMTELGQATAPVFLAPAETLGLNGFTFAFEGSIVPISNDQPFWTLPTEGDPQSVLFIPHIHVRKGLPFSFEVGTQLSYLIDSELFIIGAELRWALNEGFYYIPDLAFRVSINHMIGAKEFELSTGGWDVSLSKAFGVGGMLALTPYAGYNMMFIHASSHVTIPDPSLEIPNQVFDSMNWNDNIHHRFFVGLRLTTFIFQIAAEGAFVMGGVSMFNFKLGFNWD